MAQLRRKDFIADRDPALGSRFKPYDAAGEGFSPGAGDNHVALLQGLVHSRFGGHEQVTAAPTDADAKLEYAVSMISRFGGVALFTSVLGALVYFIV